MSAQVNRPLTPEESARYAVLSENQSRRFTEIFADFQAADGPTRLEMMLKQISALEEQNRILLAALKEISSMDDAEDGAIGNTAREALAKVKK